MSRIFKQIILIKLMLLTFVSFSLVIHGQSEPPELLFTVVVISDTHIEDENHDSRARVITVDTVKEIKQIKPKFVIHTGDVVSKDNDYDQCYDWIKKLFTSQKLPIYFVPGNHDILDPCPSDGTIPCIKRNIERFEKYFGKCNWAFSEKGFRFVGLNSFILIEKFPDNEKETFRIFLKQLLGDQCHRGTRIAFGHPASWEWDTTINRENPYFPDELRQLFKAYNVKYYIHGDLHQYYEHCSDGFSDISVPSLRNGEFLIIDVYSGGELQFRKHSLSSKAINQ